MYYVYILRCRDGTLYCGTAADWEKRIRTHFAGDARAARYTRAHPPLRPEAVWECAEKGDALRLEYRIKQLSRPEKLALLAGEFPLREEEAGLCSRLPQSALVSRDALW